MKVSNKGLAAIASHEGIVLSRYKDSVGVWTIGIGHTVNAGQPDPKSTTRELSIPEVMEIFRRDIAKFEDRVNRAVTVPLLQHEFDALVSFDFNTGGIFRAKLTKTLNTGNKIKAASQFMGWVKPPEIRGRRTAEMNLFKSGQYGSGHATIYPASPNGAVLWGSGKNVNILAQMTATGSASTPEPETPPPLSAPPPPKTQSFWIKLAALIGRLFHRR